MRLDSYKFMLLSLHTWSTWIDTCVEYSDECVATIVVGVFLKKAQRACFLFGQNSVHREITKYGIRVHVFLCLLLFDCS